MSIANITEIAQKIIDETANIVAPNTVNLMDQKGIIIASSDTERIGTFHSGALKAIEEKHEIDIYPQEIDYFQGAKQGVNIPIIKNGEAIAVIGIYGNPDEVRTSAYLLSISTSLFFDQSEKIEVEQRKKKLRSSLVELILDKDCGDEFFDISQLLGIKFNLPLNLILFSFEKSELDYDKFYYLLRKKGCLKSDSDILLKFPSCFLLIKSDEYFSKKILIDRIKTFDIKMKNVVLSQRVKDISLLPTSFSLLRHFSALPYNRDFYDISNYDDLVLIAFSTTDKIYLNCIVEKMIKKLDSYSSYWIYETIEEYLNQDGRIQVVADVLNIHKNTCIYRVNKILGICGLNDCKSITIFYFLASILHLKKSGNSEKL